MKLELYYTEDWEALYGDGKLLRQAPKLDYRSVLISLIGETIETLYTSRMDTKETIFPETVEELRNKYEITYGVYIMDLSK